MDVRSILGGGVSKYFELESVWSTDWKLGEGQSKERYPPLGVLDFGELQVEPNNLINLNQPN